MIKVILPERGIDPGGNGMFGAPRGTRLHMGVDYAAAPESIVLSPVKGRVTKVGYPYGDDLSYRYVQVTTKDGEAHRLFYVEPLVDIGNNVKVGDKLGIVQDVSQRYPIPKGMKPHVHYEIKDANGVYMNPEKPCH